MTANQWISLSLLIGRVIVIVILYYVIRKQYRVLHARNYPELNRLRRTLLLGSVIIICGNIVPVIIDTLGVFNMGSFGLLLAYVYSNNITAIFAAWVMWYNLNLAEKVQLIDEKAARKDKKEIASLKHG